MICTALAVGFVAAPSVFAEEAPEFSLDKVVVTALRAETKDLDTPASVTVKTGEELKATGATTVIDALQFTEGIAIYHQGPYGQSTGRMTSDLVIRGAKKGALILVNGVPMNMNGLFQLDNIRLDDVEKIEIVKGSSSVMYGSDAFGGVINIFMKKEITNSISMSAGNNDQQNHSIGFQTGKLAVSGFYGKTGEVNNISAPSTANSITSFYNYKGSEKGGINTVYSFDDKFTLYYNHTEDNINRERVNLTTGVLMDRLNDKDRVDTVSLKYQDAQWNASLYGVYRDLDYNTKIINTYTKAKASNINNKTSKFGVDVNKNWDESNQRYLLGLTMEQESYQKKDFLVPGASGESRGKFERNQVSLYTQATRHFSDDSTLIVGMRGQFADSETDANYKVFSPQMQYNRKLSQTSSWFVNVGKSFRLPTFTELYVDSDRLVANPNLKPESGWTYETGWKRQLKDGSLKASLFFMNFEDHIETKSVTTSTGPKSQYFNFSTFKNEGIEFSWEQKLSEKYSYVLGASYSDPRQLNKANVYEKVYSRLQGNLMLRYTFEKLDATLSANYIGKRANHSLPALPVSLMANYHMTSDSTIFATMRNVLDRHDVTTDSSSYYYAAPRTFEIGVKHSF